MVKGNNSRNNKKGSSNVSPPRSGTKRDTVSTPTKTEEKDPKTKEKTQKEDSEGYNIGFSMTDKEVNVHNDDIFKQLQGKFNDVADNEGKMIA